MPAISMFFGIIIRMYYRDHNPPHFHAEYQGRNATFMISSGKIIKGHNFPRNARKIILEWTIMHKQELMNNWSRMERNEILLKIPGADQ